MTETDHIKLTIENLLFEFWEAQPEPKPDYTQWFYRDGGPHDYIENLFLEPFKGVSE